MNESQAIIPLHEYERLKQRIVTLESELKKAQELPPDVRGVIDKEVHKRSIFLFCLTGALMGLIQSC